MIYRRELVDPDSEDEAFMRDFAFLALGKRVTDIETAYLGMEFYKNHGDQAKVDEIKEILDKNMHYVDNQIEQLEKNGLNEGTIRLYFPDGPPVTVLLKRNPDKEPDK